MNRQASHLAGLIIAALLLGACRGQSTPLATAVPATSTPAVLAATTAAPPAEPTRTATVTATATKATATPSPIPETATPAATATPDPNERVGDIVFQDPLNGTSNWFWGFQDEVASFTITDGRLKGVIAQPNAGWRFTIGPDASRFGSQQVRLTAHTVACGENDEYGLMFRVRDTGDFKYEAYLFKLRCGGAARFEAIEPSGATRAIVDWTPSPAIKTGAPADNTLLVWAAGDQFRFYVNDQYLFSAQDATLAEGQYGIYLNDRTAGGLTVTFEDLVTRAVQ